MSIQKLKNNKSDGKHNAFSCNLLNDTNMSFVLLSLFFPMQCMLTLGTIPEEMGFGTITPIIKNKRKFHHDSNNYKAIVSLVNRLTTLYYPKTVVSSTRVI